MYIYLVKDNGVAILTKPPVKAAFFCKKNIEGDVLHRQ